MKQLRPILIVVFLLFTSYSQTCPIFYQPIEGYVYLPSGYITLDELKQLNIKQVLDSNKNAIKELSVNHIAIFYKSIKTGHWSMKKYGKRTLLNPNFRDTFFNFLNLKDTIGLKFYLSKFSKSSEELSNEFGSSSFEYFSDQTYIIETQDIVDLKRDVYGNKFQVYPIPAVNEVNIKFQVKGAISGQYTTLSSTGELIEDIECQDVREEHTIDLRNLAAGTYYFNALIGGQLFSRKFVKL